MANFKIGDLPLGPMHINCAAAVFMSIKDNSAIDWDKFLLLSGYKNHNTAKVQTGAAKSAIRAMLLAQGVDPNTGAGGTSTGALTTPSKGTPKRKARGASGTPAKKRGKMETPVKEEDDEEVKKEEDQEDDGEEMWKGIKELDYGAAAVQDPSDPLDWA